MPQGHHFLAKLSEEEIRILWNVFGACRNKDGSPILEKDGRLKCFLHWERAQEHMRQLAPWSSGSRDRESKHENAFHAKLKTLKTEDQRKHFLDAAKAYYAQRRMSRFSDASSRRLAEYMLHVIDLARPSVPYDRGSLRDDEDALSA